MPDLGVFSRYKGFNDYQQEAEKQGLANALAQAQIQALQAKAMQEKQVDADKLGEQAFLKAAQGMELTPQETAALQYIDAKSPTAAFNPVTGVMEQKPSLLDRAGLRNLPPAQARNTPIRPSKNMSNDQAAQVVDLFGGDGEPVQDAPSEWDMAFKKEFDAAAGNPRLQQQLQADYSKAKFSMSDAEAKAAGFADRMLQSNPIIEQTTKSGTDMSQRAKAAVPLIGNYIVSGDYQSFNQAQRDFINAQLRRESGAVISDAEFSNAEKQYFPAPGDNENTLAQKKANRDAAIKAMQRSAGPAYKPLKIAPVDKKKESPAGATLYGTSGGKPVYKLPNGTFTMEQ